MRDTWRIVAGWCLILALAPAAFAAEPARTAQVPYAPPPSPPAYVPPPPAGMQAMAYPPAPSVPAIPVAPDPHAREGWLPPCGGNCEECLGDVCCAGLDWATLGRWQVFADALALRRDQMSDVEFAGANGHSLASNQSDAPFAAMPRLGAGYLFAPNWRIEGLYYGLGDWQEDRALFDESINPLGTTGNLVSRLSNFGNPGLTPGVDYNYLAAYEAESELDNAELHVRHRFETPPYFAFSALVGLRYLNVSETARLRTASHEPGPSDATNDVTVKTDNQMLGVQIGGNSQIYVYGRWTCAFEAKAAVLQNDASLETRLLRDPGTGTVTTYLADDDGQKTVFTGELELTMNCQVTPHFAARFGYHALWVDGLAIATQNIPRDINYLTTGPVNLDHEGRSVYHGPQIGATLSW
ncbi:MAG: BBP7 family outer membrane beta-barrel protein [Pirellulales bacterium]|nr:BBP7 family outer membrane beta-barrel protein [Pirellulales bacterium]